MRKCPHPFVVSQIVLWVLYLDANQGISQEISTKLVDPDTLIAVSSETSRILFHEYYDRLPDIQACDPGSLKESEKAKVLRRLNYVRSLHKLSAVEYRPSTDVETAEATLIMVANGDLTHYPDSTVKCWSIEGYRGASTSNLWMGPPDHSSDYHVDSFIIDGFVVGVGHRRWLLDPFLKYISYGRVDADGYSTSAAIQVIHPERQELGNDHIDFIAYPYQEYPAELFAKGWYLSFSALSKNSGIWNGYEVDFSLAQILVTRSNGEGLNVHHVRHDNIGYGLPNSLQWAVDSLVDDEKYFVKIVNVKVGAQLRDYEYWFLSRNWRTDLEIPERFDQRVSLTPTFRWRALPGKPSYRLQIAMDSKFHDRIMDNDQLYVASHELGPNILRENTEYFWRVRAIDSTGIGHDWSDSWSFKTINSQLLLRAPENGSSNVDPFVYFQWEPLTAFTVSGYEFEAASDFALKENRFVVGIPGNWSGFYFSGYSPLELNTTYFWRIRAIIAGGAQIVYSEIWSFTTTSQTDVADRGKLVPDHFALGQNFPNPFHRSTTIEFAIPTEEVVQLDIYNLSGQLVRHVMNRKVSAGFNRHRLEELDLPNGIYFYQLRAGNVKLTKKMVLARY